MNKINSLEELRVLKKEYKKLVENRFITGESNTKGTSHIDILVCGGTGCQASNSIDVVGTFKKEIERLNIKDRVKVEITGCFGFCEKGPIVKVMPENIFYIEVTPEKARRIIEEHIMKGNIVEECVYKDPETGERFPKQDDLPFYKKQMRIALRNCGLINPEDIRQYIAMDGYEALGRALFDMSPEKVIEEIKQSGLRGRGGGGFPTGVKWR